MLSRFTTILILALTLFSTAAQIELQKVSTQKKATDNSNTDENLGVPINTIFDSFFKKYVDKDGMVNYTELKKDRHSLSVIAHKLRNVKVKDYLSWSDQQQQAFWINVHNFNTLKLVAENYPIKVFKLKLIFYPKGSIMHLSKPRTKYLFNVMGRRYSLDEVEHYVSELYAGPKIHFALSYASMSSAPMRNEAYFGYKLEKQLDDQMVKFLKNPNALKIDNNKRTIYLSDIFNWYKDDIIETYGTNKKYKAYKPKIRAFFNFIDDYLSKSELASFPRSGYDVRFTHYDWHLNDVKTTK